MPKTITTTVYTFDELSDKAKEKARDWYRNVNASDFAENVSYDDFETICGILGIKVARHRRSGGKYPMQPDIQWTGFSSQGDGLSYSGEYRYQKGALKGIKKYAPLDTELYQIAKELQDAQRKYFYNVVVDIRRNNSARYVHEMTMQFEFGGVSPLASDEENFTEPLRDLARWLYRYLEKEYDFRNSDAEVDESINANKYTFTEDGRRYG